MSKPVNRLQLTSRSLNRTNFVDGDASCRGVRETTACFGCNHFALDLRLSNGQKKQLFICTCRFLLLCPRSVGTMVSVYILIISQTTSTKVAVWIGNKIQAIMRGKETQTKETSKRKCMQPSTFSRRCQCKCNLRTTPANWTLMRYIAGLCCNNNFVHRHSGRWRSLAPHNDCQRGCSLGSPPDCHAG